MYVHTYEALHEPYTLSIYTCNLCTKHINNVDILGRPNAQPSCTPQYLLPSWVNSGSIWTKHHLCHPLTISFPMIFFLSSMSVTHSHKHNLNLTIPADSSTSNMTIANTPPSVHSPRLFQLASSPTLISNILQPTWSLQGLLWCCSFTS